MSEQEDIPFYLMPVAAVFGMYTCVGSIRALYLLYANLTYKEGGTDMPPTIRLKSKGYAFLVLSLLGAAFAYAKIVASVENAVMESDHALFDPFEILDIPTDSNSTVVKKAYREMSKLHHPDKGGSEVVFHKINLAYRALSDDRENWEKYGHPDGPVQTRALSFALPEWLLHPEGTTAAVLLVLYLGMFVGLIYVVISWATKTQREAAKTEMETSVAGADAAYLASKLSPDSTHLDILFLIATTPENIVKAQLDVERAEKMKKERIAKLKSEQSKKEQGIEFDLTDEGGWADDDDDHEDEAAKAAALKAKEAEEQLAKERAQRIAEATGTKEVLIEGVDKGVIGQAWVEKALKSKQQWPPPDLGVIKDMTFSHKKNGETVGPIDHPAIRRNLCMTVGRLNAPFLNTHPELLEAGSKKLVDGTYFSSTVEYRNRAGLLLEACLRVAMAVKSYRLAKTIVETVVMFKIGSTSHDDPKVVEVFQDSMKKRYGGDAGVPRLVIKNYSVSTPDEDEIATGDVCAAQLEMERAHAEAFTKQKIAMCQQQGIPPQVGLKSYREGWWILVRAKRLDGNGSSKKKEEEEEQADNPLAKMLEGGAKERFQDEADEDRLVTAWPLIVQNVTQKGGKVKVQFRAPEDPGKYRFYVAIKSQEFLGADQEVTVEKEVVDVATVKREEDEESDGGDEGGEDEETKKDR